MQTGNDLVRKALLLLLRDESWKRGELRSPRQCNPALSWSQIGYSLRYGVPKLATGRQGN